MSNCSDDLSAYIDTDIQGVDLSVAVNIFKATASMLEPKGAYIKRIERLVSDGDDEITVVIEYVSGVTYDKYEMSLEFTSGMVIAGIYNRVTEES